MRRLIHDVDLSFPIILGPDGRVMDGMHRIARAVMEGSRLSTPFVSVSCRRRITGTVVRIASHMTDGSARPGVRSSWFWAGQDFLATRWKRRLSCR